MIIYFVLISVNKTKNETFIHEKQEDSRVKHREKKLQEMEMAYWKWREIVGNCEEGIRVRLQMVC